MSRRTEALMGTTVTIEAADTDAIGRAFDWFAVVEQACTRFDPYSELSQLTTRIDEPVAVSTLLFQALQFALEVAAASEGAFDPTVGAAMHRRGFNREHRRHSVAPAPPDPPVPVSYRDVELDPAAQTVRVRRPLQLDLGAVAKGLAIDLAALALGPGGDFAIDAGGDLYLGGLNPEGQPWSVGIRHPLTAGAFIAGIRVSNEAVCTSATYERGEHILDPRTGASPVGVASVTVIAGSAMLADALATAAFVLGRDRGLALLETMGVEGLVVTTDLRQVPTTGWRGE